MINLPDNSTDRLLAVADIIELEPWRYRQEQWWSDSDRGPGPVAGRGHVCGTTACVAGWGVALAANIPAAFRGEEGMWPLAGAWALGLDLTLADDLFRWDSDQALGPTTAMADVLRRLAKLPEGERTITRAKDVLTDDQWDALFDLDDEDDEELSFDD